MNGEQKYNEALMRAKEEMSKQNMKNDVIANHLVEVIFPELKESEDERIRKELIQYIKDINKTGHLLSRYSEEWLAWLEKQGEQKPVEWNEEDERIYQSIMDDTVQENQLDDRQTKWLSDIKYRYVPQPKQEWNEVDENEYNHILKILNLVAEEQENKGYNNLISSVNWLKSIKDRIQSKQSNKPQGKTALEAIKEEKVDNANKVEPKFKVGDIVQYITDSTDRRKIEEVDTLCNMYHTDSSPIMFEIEDEWKVVVNAEDVEQNPTDKIESLFKVGDWVVRKDGGVFFDDIKFAQITEIDGEKHWFDTGLIYLKAEDMRLWTLEDAKDGDILYSKKHNLLWRYKNTKECYFCINLNYNSNNISIGDVMVIPNDVRPATREQRHLVFDKMLRHITSKNNGKKELKKQGEHNPTDNDDKIEPKFHEGDWVIGVATEFKPRQIVEVLTSGYKTSNGGWIGLSFECGMHLWTIADANDGDVLISWTNKPFIYNGFFNEGVVGAYCGLNTFNRVIIADKQHYLYNNWTINKDVRPATKEQRDFLFQKIEDKGYEWDEEKKLLKN